MAKKTSLVDCVKALRCYTSVEKTVRTSDGKKLVPITSGRFIGVMQMYGVSTTVETGRSLLYRCMGEDIVLEATKPVNGCNFFVDRSAIESFLESEASAESSAELSVAERGGERETLRAVSNLKYSECASASPTCLEGYQ